MDVASVLVDAGILLAIGGTTALIVWLIYIRMEHRVHYGLGSFGEIDPDAMTSCPHCGARNDADRELCEYCSEPLDGDADTPGQNTDDDRWGAHEGGE